jgi:hypothetical protein
MGTGMKLNSGASLTSDFGVAMDDLDVVISALQGSVSCLETRISGILHPPAPPAIISQEPIQEVRPAVLMVEEIRQRAESLRRIRESIASLEDRVGI